MIRNGKSLTVFNVHDATGEAIGTLAKVSFLRPNQSHRNYWFAKDDRGREVGADSATPFDVGCGWSRRADALEALVWATDCVRAPVEFPVSVEVAR